MRYSKLMLAAVVGTLGTQMAVATPTPEEAAQLGKTLTPLGAIKAGNKEGTIPEWTGGFCKPPADYKPANGADKGGAPYVDPFAADKPLFKITAADVSKHADKLDEGTKEMFRRFPQTYYLNVYQTRRSACYAPWVYDNTIKRVMNPKIVGGNVPSLTGAHAQYPFPIPKNGIEAMWNPLVFFDRVFATSQYKTFYVDQSGQKTFIDSDKQITTRPYWDNSITSQPDGSPYAMLNTTKVHPRSAFGNVSLQHRQLRPDLKGDPTWFYFPGQRRVRLAPEATYDGVAPMAGGTFLYDEGSGFAGRMDKFDFKLVGRKEMYIPYNNSEQRLNYDEKVIAPNHLDPAAIRYELHRVWVVEATLKAGERHVQKRKVFHLDEDSWNMAIYVGFDHADKVHHLYYFMLAQMYDKPAISFHANQSYDLSKGAYSHWMFSGPVGLLSTGNSKIDSAPSGAFNPAGIAGGGVR